MRLSSESHLFGETIAEHGFPSEYGELSGVLGGIELPLRPAEPFTVQGRPATPKRQMKKIGGQRRYALFPVDQGRLNQLLHDRLRDAGWTAEPIAAGSPLGTPADLSLRGDFAKKKVPGARLVTIEAGGHFFMGHDTEVREAIGTFVGELT